LEKKPYLAVAGTLAATTTSSSRRCRVFFSVSVAVRWLVGHGLLLLLHLR
jgi:hypothetical protein